MANFDETEQSDNVVDRSDEVGDPVADAGNWFARQASDFGTHVADFAKNTAGYNPQAPKGSLSEQAGYNDINGGAPPVNPIMSMIRSLHQYGLTKAQTQQTKAYEFGGLVWSFDNGGSTDDDMPGNPQLPAQSEADADLERRQNAFGPAGQNSVLARGLGQQRAALPEDQGAQEQAQEADYQNQNRAIGRGLDVLNPANVPGNVEKIMNYLRGAGAATTQTHSAIKNAVDPQGELAPHDAAQQAVKYAVDKGEQQGGPEMGQDMGLSVLQAQRREFDMWRSGAAVKLQNGDMGAAVDAANRAYEGPFDHNTHFQQTRNGVTATVTDADGTVVSQHPMNVQQFSALLRSAGSFDALVQGGTRGALGTAQSLYRDTPSAQAIADQQQKQRIWQDVNKPAKPVGQEDNSIFAHISPALDAMSHKLFPYVGQERDRLQWVIGQTMQEYRIRMPMNRTVYSQEQANDRNTARIAGSEQRQTQRDEAAGERQNQRLTQRQEQFDTGWERRLQQDLARQQARATIKPGERQLLNSLIQQNTGDLPGLRKAVTDAGYDFNDVFGIAGQSSNQPAPGRQPGGPAAPQVTRGKGSQAEGTSGGGQWVRDNTTGKVVFRNADGSISGGQ